MSLGWKLFFGTLVVASGATCYLYRKNKSQSFEEYTDNCISEAKKEMESISDSIKTILVLAKINETDIAPYFYSRHQDCKVTKKRVNYKSYPFRLCPSHVQDAIIKGEYIIYKF